ncbi:deoxyribose-phosphate aldolase [Methanobacterium sp.]|uniref:deoxyribose-phosphate aldolase n=1 Tax=Methanobacterium sp. TaxID=2164 RepID=UPI003C74F66B
MIVTIESPENLAKIIDHTNLKPDATLNDIEKLCNEAKKYGFAFVCVNPSNVRFAVELLKDESTKVCTVVGFPLGANTSKIKFFEAKDAVESGASEIDMVMNIGALKSGLDDNVKEDINSVVEAASENAVKVIIETALLDDEEIIRACEIIKDSGANFVKTSTGMHPGAKIEDINLIKETVGSSLNIKASGGINKLKTALDMRKAGASRIGTSSGVKIMEEALKISTSNI